MKIIGVYNIKGGVGKTASAVNLAYSAYKAGNRTLIWDLDPQAAASFYFRVKPKVQKSKKILKGQQKIDIDRMVKATDFDGLDILPADFSYRKMDEIFHQQDKPAMQLLRLLRPLSQHYDIIFLDCPPNISLVSENIFKAADSLIIPTIPTTLSLRTLNQLLDFIDDKKLHHLKLMPFFSMVDKRKNMHREMIGQSLDQRIKTLKNYIVYSSVVEKMGIERAPVASFDKNHPVAKDYDALWDEIIQQL